MSTRGRSKTLGSLGPFATVPKWVRFLVEVVTNAGQPSAMRHVTQGFTRQSDAQRWARAMSLAIPADTADKAGSRAWMARRGVMARGSQE
jgi:hypothetical protein